MFKNGFGDMIKKAQEMQANMEKIQKEIGQKTVIGQSGAGAVQVILNGHYGCQGVQLSPEALAEDKEMLEALLAAAINDATKKAQELNQSSMSTLTGGLNLPAGFKLPF